MTTPWKPLSHDECCDLPEVEKLRKALVYVAFALHGTPQHMLAPGITLIDGDTVRVSRDGWTVEASTDPRRQPSASTKPCPTCSAPCEITVNPRGGEYGWGTTDAERTTYRYAGVRP